jgi:AraC family transcriptional regulator
LNHSLADPKPSDGSSRKLIMETTAPDSSSGADQKFHFVANSLARLLETARRELERDREAAKASLVTASHILQAEIERRSGANGSTRGGLAAWQMLRVRAYIDSNLHRTIHIRDLMMTSAEPLSEIALSVGFSDQAHLCRLFRQAFGQSPARWRRERGIPGEVTSRTGMDENIPSAISAAKS